MAETVTVTTTITDPTAHDIELSVIDVVMPQGANAKMETVAMALVGSNGSVMGFAGPDFDIGVIDGQVKSQVEAPNTTASAANVILASVQQSIITLADFFVIGRPNTPPPPVEITTTDETEIIAASGDSSLATFIQLLIVANLDTSPAIIDIRADLAGAIATTLIVEAQKTLVISTGLSQLQPGAANKPWTAQLRGVGDVVITAGIKYAVI